MPVDFTLDRDARVMRSRAWGVVTEAEIADHGTKVRELLESGAITAAWGQLLDFLGVTRFEDLPSDGIRRLAEKNPWPQSTPRAFVIADPVTFGMSRMYQAHACIDANTLTTDSVGKAEAWLGRRMKERPR